MTPEEKQLLIDLKDRIDRLERSDRYQFDKAAAFRHKIGFFNKSPKGQTSASGITTNMTTNGGVAVTEANGFSGSAGGGGVTFYTIGDIVRALKDYGLLAE